MMNNYKIKEFFIMGSLDSTSVSCFKLYELKIEH